MPNNQQSPLDGQIKKTVLILLVALLVGCGLIYFGHGSDAVNVAKNIKSGVLTSDEVNVAFEKVGGKLVDRRVNESDIVKDGDLLLVIDPVDTQITINGLEAQLSSLKAQLAQTVQNLAVSEANTDLKEKSSWRQIELLQASVTSAKASLDLAQIEYDRYTKLAKDKAVAQSLLDTATNNLTSAHSELLKAERELSTQTIGASDDDIKKLHETGSAEGMQLSSINNERLSNDNIQNEIKMLQAQIKQVEANLDQEKLNLTRLNLKTTQNGKILRVLYEVGEVIPNGATAVLLETDRRYFDIFINELQAPGFKPGDTVKAYAPAIDKEITGKIRFTNPAPSFSDLRNTRERGQSDLTTFQVRIYVDDDPDLLTGMTLEVRQ